MDTTAYYFRQPGGDVSGPLPLDSIRVAIKVGRLGEMTEVSETGGDPWLSMESPAAVASRQRAEPVMNSKLMACPACSKEIAKSAPRCPHCGKQFSTPVGLILAVIIGLIIGWVMIANTCSQAAAVDRAAEQLRAQ